LPVGRQKTRMPAWCSWICATYCLGLHPTLKS